VSKSSRLLAGRPNVSALISFARRHRWSITAAGGVLLAVLVTGLGLAGRGDETADSTAVVADVETPSPTAADDPDPAFALPEPEPMPPDPAVADPEKAASDAEPPAVAAGPSPGAGDSRPEPVPEEPEVAPAPPAEQEAIDSALRGRAIRALDTLLVAPENSKRRNWARSSRYCEELETAGVGGWRLPEVGELLSLKRSRLVGRRVYWSNTVGDSYGGHRLVYNAKRRRIVSMRATWRGGRTVCVRDR
jgi:hypothetical protein